MRVCFVCSIRIAFALTTPHSNNLGIVWVHQKITKTHKKKHTPFPGFCTEFVSLYFRALCIQPR